MRIDASDIQGLMPSVDARRTDKTFALSGQNFILDVQGPKSAFGNRMLTPYFLGAPEHTQGCRLKLSSGDRVFTFTSDSILEWREETGTWRVIYVTGDLVDGPFRWTHGYLNGIMYFCHPIIGILAYKLLEDICLPLDSDGLPADPLAIKINSGRLIIMSETFIYWSAPSDGTDWTPRLGGAGFQLIADRVSGSPIMITVWAGGIMCWTTGGVLRGEFTGDSSVYRWRAINTEYRPVNSFCTLEMDDNTMVILDSRGLFKSQGGVPEPMTPLFNEFLLQYIQNKKIELGQNCRIEWDERRRALYLSLSLSQYNPLYEKAYVLDPSLDKWGTFDEAHFGITPILIQNSSRAGDFFGFVDRTGVVKYWGDQRTREIVHTRKDLNAYQTVNQKPVHYFNGAKDIIVVSSSGRLSTIQKSKISGREGFYKDGTGQPVVAEVTDLDSYIQFGYMRFQDQQSHDHQMEIVSCFVGSVPSEMSPAESEDYNTSTNPNEDWNLLSGQEDWGFGHLNFIDHGLRIIGTFDGDEEEDSQDPYIERANRSGRYYSCSVMGQWHIIEISARALGQSYHVKIAEFTAVDGGKLN